MTVIDEAMGVKPPEPNGADKDPIARWVIEFNGRTGGFRVLSAPSDPFLALGMLELAKVHQLGAMTPKQRIVTPR